MAEDLNLLAPDVAEHLLLVIDNAVPTDPTPQELKTLAEAYAQVNSHRPKGEQYSRASRRDPHPPAKVPGARGGRHVGNMYP